MSLLFNMLSRLVITFLLRTKCLLISWLQLPSAVILEPKKIKSVTVSIVSPLFAMKWWYRMPWSSFFECWVLSQLFECWVLSQLFHSPLSLSSTGKIFSSSSLSAIRVVSSAYLRLLIFLPAILIPACASSSLVFRMMYSAYKLNKQGDNIQPWCTPFPIWNQSVVLCLVLTVASWPAYRFLRRQVRWSGIPISLRIFQFVVIHTVKGFGVVNKGDVFLEFSCSFYDPTDVGNSISDSSAFCKFSLNIWKFTVHVLLKPGLENFELYFASLWDACNCAVVWTFFGIAFLWDLNTNWPFPVLCSLGGPHNKFLLLLIKVHTNPGRSYQTPLNISICMFLRHLDLGSVILESMLPSCYGFMPKNLCACCWSLPENPSLLPSLVNFCLFLKIHFDGHLFWRAFCNLLIQTSTFI